MKENIFRKKFLGKSAIGAVFCVCIMLASVAAAINLPKNTEQTTKEVNSLSYTFLFKEPTLESTRENNQDFSLVNLDGCLPIGKTSGAPMLPVKPITILLPPMKTVSNIQVVGTPTVTNTRGFDLTQKIVYPYQDPVPFGNSPSEFVIDEITYATNAMYPGVLKDDYQIGYSHGYTLLNTVLNPVQYNPVEGKLVYYPEMTVNIELTDTQNANHFYRNNPDDKAWVEKLVYNPDIANLYTSDVPTFDYPGGLCDPSEHYDYVIITTTTNGLNYWDTSDTTPYNWQSLMDKHASDDGLSCTLVTVQDINACTDYHNDDPLFDDQQAHIREFCKDAYQDWGTRYVLIGGDADTIPARQLYYEYEGGVDSDLYWSNLDNNFNANHNSQWGEAGDSGFDLYSELYIGRVTCDVPQDVSNWLTKSFYYADSVDAEYLSHTGFYGGDTTWNCQGDDFIDYSAIKGTSDWLGPNPDENGPFPTWAGFQYGFETWNSENPENQYDLSVKWTAEPPNPGWQGGSDSAAITGFRDAINNDHVTVISAIAHANEQMSCDVYASDWASLYHNTKPFFIHDYGCHCGDFDAADDGVLDVMLFNSNTYLAFGCVYNTGYGWGQYDNTNSSSAFQAKQFWSYFLDVQNKSGDLSNWQLGKGHAWSKDSMAPTIDWDTGNGGTWRGVIECCLLFGDPAQNLRSPHPSEPPATPTLNAPSEWVQNIDCPIKVKTTDPEGDQVLYLLDWGDGTMSEWLGPSPSGQETTAYHSYADLGSYEVKVRARDIWGAVSGWSEPTTITIIVNSPPNKPTITGQKILKAQKEYTYTVSAVDPNGHDVYFYIWWGDGDYVNWEGPYHSGQQATFKNSWPTTGSYNILVKAKDFIGAESGITTLDITVTKSKTIDNFLLQKILERFANYFPILEKILKI